MLFNKSRYDENVLPTYPVWVDAMYTLQYVNSLDTKSQTLSTTGYFTVVWTDDRLNWIGSDYANIENIFVPVNKVWHPELVVLNSMHELQKNIGDERPIQIFNNGTIVWKPIVMLSTFCKMFIAFFPFDYQLCHINLASLDLPNTAMYLFPIISSIYHEPILQGDWQIAYTPSYGFHATFETISGSNDMLQFWIGLKRIPGHYLMIVVFPTVITAILTFVTFFLPLKSGIRIGYILTVVLALVVLLTFFAETMPSSTEYPSILVGLFTIALGMAFLLIIITVFVMGLYNKPKSYIAPNWMYSMVRKIRMLKLKLKCKARRINSLESTQSIEDCQPTEERDSVKKRTPLKQYSNKELAAFCDSFLFVVFTVLYILILVSIPIAAIIWIKDEGNIHPSVV
ncbi:neuronal acetylcholine receptor subunit alpha-3-like [Mytilus edulis]|uniref:neuronal acetylcholine receptor subunit alpha-3-like n=1 Tax=Mytilus edulis TaxID=6550 RepID=UPI0039EFC871